jgi:drug/metabolite transporter (DMT)-like permease
VIAILLAWVFFKERISPLRWIGIIMTFSGVAALTAHQ